MKSKINIVDFKKIKQASPFSKSYKTTHVGFRHEVSGNYSDYLKNYENYIPYSATVGF